METVARACDELRPDLGATRSEHTKHLQAPQYTLLAFGGWDTWTCVCCKGNCERKNEEAQLEPNAQPVLHYLDSTDRYLSRNDGRAWRHVGRPLAPLPLADLSRKPALSEFLQTAGIHCPPKYVKATASRCLAALTWSLVSSATAITQFSSGAFSYPLRMRTRFPLISIVGYHMTYSPHHSPRHSDVSIP